MRHKIDAAFKTTNQTYCTYNNIGIIIRLYTKHSCGAGGFTINTKDGYILAEFQKKQDPKPIRRKTFFKLYKAILENLIS